MKKGLLTLLLSFFSFFNYGQTDPSNASRANAAPERFPVFSNCANLEAAALENCFYTEVQDFVFENFVRGNNYLSVYISVGFWW